MLFQEQKKAQEALLRAKRESESKDIDSPYKQFAELAGNPGASRAVGTIMSHNYDLEIPCHRVVRSDGKIGE